MVRVRFWILMLASLAACALYFEQIYLSQEINRQQAALMDRQRMITLGASYENSWRRLAARIFQLGQKDPALAEVLKREQIDAHFSAPGTSGATAAPAGKKSTDQ